MLNLLIKSCDLLEYLTKSHKFSEKVLKVDPVSMKKMVNRNNSNIHVDIRTMPAEDSQSSQSQPPYGKQSLSGLKKDSKFSFNSKKYKYFKDFMLSMATHYQVSKAKSEDVKEAI